MVAADEQLLELLKGRMQNTIYPQTVSSIWPSTYSKYGPYDRMEERNEEKRSHNQLDW